MKEPAPTTVRYRLLNTPSLGPTRGNTVLVGMNVEFGDQLADLVFEGMPRRIEQVIDALDLSPARFGYRFSPRHRTTALDLRHAMKSVSMVDFQPELVAGAEIFERTRPT